MSKIPRHEPSAPRKPKGQRKQSSRGSYPTNYERECAASGHEPSDIGEIGWALTDLARHVRDYAQGDIYGGLEVELKSLADAVQGFAYNATIGENSLNLFTASSSSPVRLELEGDAVDSIADSLKRIADAMTARGAEQGTTTVGEGQ